jgi:hypothetical protein
MHSSFGKRVQQLLPPNKGIFCAMGCYMVGVLSNVHAQVVFCVSRRVHMSVITAVSGLTSLAVGGCKVCFNVHHAHHVMQPFQNLL